MEEIPNFKGIVRNYIKDNWGGKDMDEYLAKKSQEWLSKLRKEVNKYEK